MPISGLAITLARDSTLADAARRALDNDGRVELGPEHAHRIAATIETQSQQEDRRLREWIDALPGVTHVDIAFIHFDDEPPVDGAGARSTRPERAE